MSDRAFFISDVHLGLPNGRRSDKDHQDALISFLRHLEPDDRLFIVGDLFDFWFEYQSSVPTIGTRVIFELYGLRQRGVPVVILPGNHDIWLGSYLRDHVGLEVQQNPLMLELHGKRLYITHGDEFTAVDWRYPISRAILRSSLCIRLFKLIHPDLGVRLGRLMSQSSEGRVRRTPEESKRLYVTGAESLTTKGHDIVFCGHFHSSANLRIRDGRVVVIGNWIRSDTYALMEDGEVQLMEWKGDHGEPFVVEDD